MRLLPVLLVVALHFVPASASATEWRTYVNDRFGTVVDVPADVFVALPPADNGDGQRWQSADGASLTVFAGHNAQGLGIADLIAASERDAADERVTYRARGQRWFVLSGFRGDDVFYRKLLLSPDGMVAHTLELVYPAAEKRAYDPLTTRIANSLSAGD